jgi:hypothetical protein
LPATSLRLEPCLCMEPVQSSADGPGEIHYAALRSAYDLSDNDGSRVVASALGEFLAAR